MNIEIIAFDADDTLWDNEPLFQSIEKELCILLTEYGNMERIFHSVRYRGEKSGTVRLWSKSLYAVDDRNGTQSER